MFRIQFKGAATTRPDLCAFFRPRCTLENFTGLWFAVSAIVGRWVHGYYSAHLAPTGRFFIRCLLARIHSISSPKRWGWHEKKKSPAWRGMFAWTVANTVADATAPRSLPYAGGQCYTRCILRHVRRCFRWNDELVCITIDQFSVNGSVRWSCVKLCDGHLALSIST